jgi:hypothetical protein
MSSDQLFGLLIIAFLLFIWLVIHYFIPKWFGNDINIEITPENIRASSNGKELVIAPVIFISSKDGKRRVLSFGNETKPIEPHEKLFLFNLNMLPRGLTKIGCFSIFFSHVFSEITGRKVFNFARVRFRGLDYLDPVFEGRQEKDIWKALKFAGARTCSFID